MYAEEEDSVGDSNQNVFSCDWLLLRVELVQDRTTKEPVSAADITKIVDFCRDHGLIVGRAGGARRYANTIPLCPPLVITRAECDRIVDTLDRALGTLDLG